MHRLRVHILGFCLVALSVAIPVSAQTVPKTEVSGGYQFLNFSVEGENESLGKGWYLDVAGNLTPMLGIVFQVGGNYKSTSETFSAGGVAATATSSIKVHEFLGGVRLNARSDSTIVPYGQVLVGGVTGSVEASVSSTVPGAPPVSFALEESGTNVGLELGGGVNFGFTDSLGIRAGADYLRIFEEGGGANLFRFHIGVVLSSGRR